MYRCARYKYGHFINFNFQFMMNEELLYRKFSWQYFRIIPYIKSYLIKLFDCADKKCRIKDQSSYRPIDSPVKLKCENKYKKCSWSQYRSNTIKIAPLKCVHFSQKLRFVAAIVTQDLVDFLSSFWSCKLTKKGTNSCSLYELKKSHPRPAQFQTPAFGAWATGIPCSDTRS